MRIVSSSGYVQICPDSRKPPSDLMYPFSESIAHAAQNPPARDITDLACAGILPRFRWQRVWVESVA